MTLLGKQLYSDHLTAGWIPWGVLAPVLALIMVIGPLILTDVFILSPQGLVDADGNPTSTYGLVGLLVVSFGLVGLLVAAWVRFVERRPFSSVGLSLPGLKLFVRGHAIGIAMVCCTIAGIAVAGGYTVGEIAPALTSPIVLFQIALLLFSFAIQSSVEEFVFRGWLMSVLAHKFNILAAILVNSALFAFMHFNPANAWYDNVNTLAFGLFASTWAVRANSIWGVMGWHAGWNWFTAIGFEVPITGLETGTSALIVQLSTVGPNWLSGGTTGPEGSIICTAVLLAGTLYWWRRKPKVSPQAATA